MPRLQKCFAMGTKEAEYMVVAKAGKELICFNNFLEELEKSKAKSVMYCDNLLKNMVFNSPVKFVYQGGDNREVEDLRKFNWPLR
ncbi:hypothetical protein Tco_0875593 [Tanacetum coccineum]|uniref:Uncharacterized protein n=1 Tax=Tanacetum coccineum TaxID=301880 RepID=A0ABQ5BSR9_9ASTR